jgi:squalene-hopene/tetraprenyl-beta-curcumene cyclase
VVKKSVEFLLRTVRGDGSWPIDTNLATWATTLAVKALAIASTEDGKSDDQTLFDGQERVLNWLLRQQYREVHPFTNSPPGGWAWTDLSGGVPDADDTPAALLALAVLDPAGERNDVRAAAAAGVRWLLDLQNRDGGIPTFCRGWGALPFDRSSPDLTAHTLRAWHVWRPRLPAEVQERIDRGVKKALCFLERQRRSDGSWSPLWFGNQHRLADEENPTYGTAKVALAFLQIGREDLADPGLAWLREHQNADGGWGSLRDVTPSTIEETALAMSVLAGAPVDCAATNEVLARGEKWLCEATKKGTAFEPSPIGFYFARLWYFEKAYPVVWTVEALSRVSKRRG